MVRKGITNEKTSSTVATGAAKVLKSKTASAAKKTLAASAPAQRNPMAQTSDNVTKIASKVLSDPKSTVAAKSIAASTLT